MKFFALPIRYGLATSACLIIYFLILSLLDLHTNIFFSLFNAILTGAGIYMAIKGFREQKKEGFTYGNGFIAGLVAGGVATCIFTLFFAVYSTELNPEFLEQLSAVWFKKYQSFQTLIFFFVAVMGFATTIVLTLSFMQLFKSSNNLVKKTG